jgi:uncharacterized BrkB/YihY/UPF0761 family membrane protein
MEGTQKLVQQKKSKGLWTKSKGLRLCLLNLVLFICFVLLSLTGLITWVILPRGYRFRDGGELHALRDTLIELHEWVALVFIALVVVHLVWHWSYIKANAKRWLSLPVQ